MILEILGVISIYLYNIGISRDKFYVTRSLLNDRLSISYQKRCDTFVTDTNVHKEYSLEKGSK